MKALLSLALLLSSAQAFAGAKEFQALCERADLPDATRATVESMVRLAGGPFTSDKITCAQAAVKLNAMSEITLMGSTFEYYFVKDLSPFALLDGLKELAITNQKDIYDLSPIAGKKIEALHLSGTGVSNLSQLEKFPNLRELSLTVTADSPVWDLGRLDNLRSLSLQVSGNKGRIDLQPLRDLHALETLNINSYGVKIQGLGSLTSVRSLSTSLVALDGATLAKMNLTSLNVDRGSIANVNALAGLQYIQSLTLHEVGLTNIDFVRGLTKLKKLALSKNQIRDASPVAGLLDLESLDLNNNEIDLFTEVMKNLFRLKTLDLTSNKISYSVDISSLVNLESLRVSYNFLHEVNTRDAVLPKLREIEMNGNSVRAVEFLKASAMPALQSLNLNYNRIFKIDAVGALTTLKKLEIDDNRIQDITPLMSLKNLERMSARSNLLVNPVCPVAKADVCDFMHQGI